MEFENMTDPADTRPILDLPPGTPPNVEKMAEGHVAIMDARNADLDYVRAGKEKAAALARQLGEDRDTLEDYGFSMPQRFVRMAADALEASKALELATETLVALQTNDWSYPTPGAQTAGPNRTFKEALER